MAYPTDQPGQDYSIEEKALNLKKRGRIVFLFWALYAAPAIYSLQYVRPKLIVFGDAVTTVNNIMPSSGFWSWVQKNNNQTRALC